MTHRLAVAALRRELRWAVVATWVSIWWARADVQFLPECGATLAATSMVAVALLVPPETPGARWLIGVISFAVFAAANWVNRAGD